jgi:hypothetical protein
LGDAGLGHRVRYPGGSRNRTFVRCGDERIALSVTTSATRERLLRTNVPMTTISQKHRCLGRVPAQEETRPQEAAVVPPADDGI